MMLISFKASLILGLLVFMQAVVLWVQFFVKLVNLDEYVQGKAKKMFVVCE